MSDKATPRPWHSDEPYFIYIWGPGQKMVADLGSGEEAYLARIRGVGRGATQEEQQANARLIVSAVNAYEAHQRAAEALRALDRRIKLLCDADSETSAHWRELLLPDIEFEVTEGRATLAELDKVQR